MSTSASRRTSSGAWLVSAIAVSPPNDMPTTSWACGASAWTATATSVALRRGANGPSVRWSEWPCPGRSTATSGRSSASATVSQVWAFWAPPSSSRAPAALAPHEGAEPAPVRRDHDRFAAHDAWPVPRDPVILGVLVQQAELVVGLRFGRRAAVDV